MVIIHYLDFKNPTDRPFWGAKGASEHGNSTQKDNMFYLKRITQFYSSENYTIKYLAFKRICLISMTTTMYHLNCQSDQLDFPRQVFICLVKFFCMRTMLDKLNICIHSGSVYLADTFLYVLLTLTW